MAVHNLSGRRWHQPGFIRLNMFSPAMIQDLAARLATREQSTTCSGLVGSARTYLISRLYRSKPMPLLIITPSAKEAAMVAEELTLFTHATWPISFFPPYNLLPFKALAYHNETAARRIRTLYQLAVGERPPIVVTSAEALLQALIPKRVLCDWAELLMVNEECDPEQLARKLVAGGYIRVSLVEEPGDFCVRGGLLDIFSPLYSDPLRVEFFGDQVDTLRLFSAVSQRTRQHLQEAILLPARESVIDPGAMDQLIHRIRSQAARQRLPVTRIRKLVEQLKGQGGFPGMESLMPLFHEKTNTLLDYVPSQALICLFEPERLEDTVAAAEKQALDNFQTARDQGRLCVSPEQLYLPWGQVRARIEQSRPLYFKTLPVAAGIKDAENILAFDVQEPARMGWQGQSPRQGQQPLGVVADWLQDWRSKGGATVLTCASRAQLKRLTSLLAPYGLNVHPLEHFPDIKTGSGSIYGCHGQIANGFVWMSEALAVLTETDIIGVKPHRRPKATAARPRTELIAFEDLKQGDLVVHDEHGVGQFEGLAKLTVNGNANDFLLILYRDGDKLYLPVDRMRKVHKYMGLDGVSPTLDKMGGKAWGKVKQRVKKSAQKIAGELLKLYAARRANQGHLFSQPDSYFHDFEAGFAFEETADQLQAIEQVITDMQNATPMDRLVCGDVGYGKTEVALRAAFVAVNDGKQVAVLVPTTVLAEQHFATFSERFERFPVKIACLSRFRSPKQQRAIINQLKAGQLDIVIGTHRLLQKDVSFKDLGLLVLDEEQRFGVRHKERLKRMRRTVDVLTLTATPIPRTLHLSLMGIRDISVIATPPEQRRSIITYISEPEDSVIAEALRKELRRGGQAFFVHNNIHSIERVAGHLKQLVPEVRLDVAHGRLGEDELESVMWRFIEREIDLLVCTTIIESGLDIPAANTILINRADKFGLAQIYQLRGRVGRGDEQAYAYLFIPNESVLSKDAQKRLKVLMEHSDLGAGFQIAMSDLQIRGGGAILGAEQSGHIAAVGYDMFLQLMENAIAEIKGEPVIERLEPEINLPVSAFFPETYITDIEQRLAAYRRLAKMEEIKELTDFKAELSDRFGALPEPAVNLLLKMVLKILAVKAGVSKLDLSGHQLALSFSEPHQKNPQRLVELIMAHPSTWVLTPEQVLRIDLAPTRAGRPLAQTKNILKEIAQHVTG